MSSISLYLNSAQDGSLPFVVVCLAWIGRSTQEAVSAVRDVLRGWSHRREVARRNVLHEQTGITYRLPGSPPSHRAAGARP